MGGRKVLYEGKSPVVGCLGLALAAVLVVAGLLGVEVDCGPFSGLRSGTVFRPPFDLTPHRVDLTYSGAAGNTELYVWADAGQSVVVDYDLSRETGSLYLWVWGPRSWFQRWVTPLGAEPLRLQQRLDIHAGGPGRFAVRVGESGYYKVVIDPARLTGQLVATVDVQ